MKTFSITSVQWIVKQCCNGFAFCLVLASIFVAKSSIAGVLHVLGAGSHTQMAEVAKVEFHLSSRALLEKSLLGSEKPPEIDSVFSSLRTMEKTAVDAIKEVSDIRDLVSGGLRFNPMYSWNKSEEKRLLQGYEGHLRISFIMDNRERLNVLYDLVARLTESGIVQRFVVTDALENEMACLKKAREQAINDAWLKAKHLAEGFKLKVSELKLEEARITSSMIEPRRDPIVRAAMMRSADAVNGPELTPAQKECIVNLEASFTDLQ